MLSMERASKLAEMLQANPTKIAEVSRLAWGDGGSAMLMAVSDFAGVPLAELLRAGGIQKNWDRAVGTANPLSHGDQRKRDGFHQPGAREDLRRASAGMSRKW